MDVFSPQLKEMLEEKGLSVEAVEKVQKWLDKED